MRPRIIPTLLIEDGGLVKTQKFSKGKYIGDPINAINLYNEMEVDELIIIDITASKMEKNPDLEMISETCAEAFMPISYSGGVTTIEQYEQIFNLGVEKVFINSSLRKNPTLVKEASKHFGSQSVGAIVDVKKNFYGQYKVYDHCDRKLTNLDLKDYLERVQGLGVGEIIIYSVDRDGMMSGYDMDLISKLSSTIKVPLIICGGANSICNMVEAIENGADAAAAGSFFVFSHTKTGGVLINYPSQEELTLAFSKLATE